MKSNRQLFFEHVAQTSTDPLAIEIERAEGIFLYGTDGTKYVDLVSGVSVSNVGHHHPKVVKAVKDQADRFMHLMVYGEIVQSPQVEYAHLLSRFLPAKHNSIYFVNSGSEAIEGAMKLAKRATGRHQVVAFKNAYHGGTHGALSILGHESLKQSFRPLLPGITHIEFNKIAQLNVITKETACVVIEPIQAEAGIILPDEAFMKALRNRCDDVGALLIFDEIQTGFGRTGKMFAGEHFNVEPDIMAIAKGMGGGMPIGGFTASDELMKLLTHNPALGHITTFGGHPVSCAAAKASLEVIESENLIQNAIEMGELFSKLVAHDRIVEIRGMGLFLAVELKNIFIPDLMKFAAANGIIFDPFLFNSSAFRIAPPLIIKRDEVIEVSKKLVDLVEKFIKNDLNNKVG